MKGHGLVLSWLDDTFGFVHDDEHPIEWRKDIQFHKNNRRTPISVDGGVAFRLPTDRPYLIPNVSTIRYITDVGKQGPFAVMWWFADEETTEMAEWINKNVDLFPYLSRKAKSDVPMVTQIVPFKDESYRTAVKRLRDKFMSLSKLEFRGGITSRREEGEVTFDQFEFILDPSDPEQCKHYANILHLALAAGMEPVGAPSVIPLPDGRLWIILIYERLPL